MSQRNANGHPLCSWRDGFTLIELLVLILIIVVLALILMPQRPPREKNWRLRYCLANQKQLASALLMYADDHQERFPPAHNWPAPITRYVKHLSLFTCPGDDAHPRHPGAGPYAMAVKCSSAAIDRIAHPDERPLLWDATGQGTFNRRHGGRGLIAFADGHAKSYDGHFLGMGRGSVGIVPSSPKR